MALPKIFIGNIIIQPPTPRCSQETYPTFSPTGLEEKMP